ncbi:MAG: tetratricopeptide repeat protein [Methanothrix sp.]|nr:MAG: tetratricopeptide repeat protein [Methanothrix sp.]
MKKCLECNAEVDDRAYVCPKCGGGTLIGSYSAEDALSMLDAMKGQSEATKHVDLSAQFYVQGRLDDAIAELQAALKINPLNPTAHGNMGAVLLKQGKPKEAVPWLEKALELNPNLEGIPTALAQAKSASEKKSGCFVATACFGDPNCPEVVVLQTYRDEHLATFALGRIAIRGYYACSPPLAVWLQRHPRLQSIVRQKLLHPLVMRIQRVRGR